MKKMIIITIIALAAAGAAAAQGTDAPKTAEDFVSRIWDYNWDNPDEVKKAVADCTQAIRIDPKYADAYYWRGFFYEHYIGDFEKAISDYSQVIKLNPLDGYDARGDAYERHGDYAKAVADFTQCIKLEPDDAGYYLRRGNVYLAAKDYAKAIADHTRHKT